MFQGVLNKVYKAIYTVGQVKINKYQIHEQLH
jgi:hypothetical protein